MPFDFAAAVSSPHRMQPGLRRLAWGAQQLTPATAQERNGSRHLREKLAVLWAYRDQALLCQPGFDAGPALAALQAHAAAEHPHALQLDGAQLAAPGLGWALGEDGMPHSLGTGWPETGALLLSLPLAWRRTALLCLAFAEDFAVLDSASGCLPWLAVALPSLWAPEHKLGRHFTEVHAPVADNRLITGAAPHLIQLVTGLQRWERFVWTFSAHPRLHAHPDRVDPARWPAGLHAHGSGANSIAAHTWWRTERQTFIPVPGLPAGGRQAVFTIKVDSTPLALAFAQAAQAGQVHDALASMSDAVLAYRGLTAVQAPLLQWLAWRAGQPDGLPDMQPPPQPGTHKP